MHLTDNEAAMRAADRENAFTRKARNNRRLNAAVLLLIAAATAAYFIPSQWGL
ncbi:hypothetical protein [Ralstonia wenshanensis]|uniref:hypothetical protein n=1 Tax=Ralstonia wenshanensis TaxID=2842456 RepID=UPI003D992F72